MLPYKQKLSVDDVEKLQNVFGRNNVYDFSGHNLFTKDYNNYYETSHYRPSVAADILSIIYNTDSVYHKFQIGSLYFHAQITTPPVQVIYSLPTPP